MVELCIRVTPHGVYKTQVLGTEEEETAGLALYARLRPLIRRLDKELRNGPAPNGKE